MNIRLLDCTLRDGAHVNKGDFGVTALKKITKALEASKIDIIELGFLRDIPNYIQGSSIFHYLEDFENLKIKRLNSLTSLMIRPDQYNINKLNKKSSYIDILRFAFYEKDLELTKDFILKAHNLGYKIGANPINIGMYPKEKIEKILNDIAFLPIQSVAIVDTFGMLKKENFKEICKIFENNLPQSIELGIHLHENLSLSFGLICDYLEFGSKERNIIIDCALFGMGRIPGNLCTEIIAYHLVKQYAKKYKLKPILDVISNEIEPIKNVTPWGYSPVYLLTAEKGVHRSYGEFLNKQNVNYSLAEDILEEIKKTNQALSYDEKLICQILKEYQGETK